MSNIRFRSAAHRDFFLEMMNKSKVNDCYHRAFFYVMGIAAETRANINQMFDFKTDCIEPEGMHGGWQTSGTVKVCHLAFNLWNGYTEKENGRYFTPDELFCCEYAPYFVEGIKVRYPEYCRDLPAPKQQTEHSRYGDTRASNLWEYSWMKEWLNSYSTDSARAEKALEELEKAFDMPYMGTDRCDDATRNYLRENIDKAKLGDPSGFRECIELNYE